MAIKLICILSLSIILSAIYYVMNISVSMALIAILYGLLCIFIPGLLLQLSILNDNEDAEKDENNYGHQIPGAIILGIGIAFLSYLSYMGLHHKAALYLFAVPYLIALSPKARKRISHFGVSLYRRFRYAGTINIVVLGTCFGFFLLYCTLYYPLPGNGPIVVDLHPTSQASYLVSFTRSFPAKSMGTYGLSDTFNYNSLCHMVGVNFCTIFKMPAYSFIFKYYYFVIIPLYFISILSLFNNLKIRSYYILYGMPLLLFGGEFLFGDLFFEQIYTPELLGHMILYNLLSVVIACGELNSRARFTLYASAAFLLVGARLPAAIVAVGGITVFIIFDYLSVSGKMQWRTLLTILLSGMLGYTVFFLYGANKLFTGSSGADTPFYYFFYYLYQLNTLPNMIKVHYIDSIGNINVKALLMSYMGVVYWPFSMMLNAFYAVPIYPLLMEKLKKKTAVRPEYLLLSIIVFAYLYIAFIKIGEREFFAIMEHGFRSLILLFLLQIQDIGIFGSLRKGGVLSYRSITDAQTFPMPGACIKSRAVAMIVSGAILILPFSNMAKKFMVQARHFGYAETSITLWGSSRLYPIGNRLFYHLYDDQYNYIDGDMYRVLSFIRDKTTKDTVVVAPYFVRPVQEYSFFVTAFTERSAYLENRYYLVEPGLWQKRKLAMWKLVNEGTLDSSFNAKNYVFMLTKVEYNKLSNRRVMRLLYSTGKWTVSELM